MSRNKLIIKNTVFLATRTVFSLVISFYTTRIVLHQLGVSDYGLFSVIYGVVAFFVFIVAAMNDSVQRFISINIGSNNTSNVRDVIKNSVLVYLLAGVLFVIVLFLFKPFIINGFLNIQSNSIETAKTLYLIALCSIFVSILQTPFNAMVLAHEKMSFYAYMSIFDACSKLSVSFLIVHIPYNKVIVYSFLLFVSTVVVFLIYLLYCFKRFRGVLLGGVLKWNVVKDITFFSFWNVFGNFAYVCRTQGINIIINLFFATTVNAAYALATTVLNAINSLTQSLITAIRPQIFKSYAEGDISRYNLLVSGGSKYTFSLLFILSCPVLLCSRELLTLWLGNVPDYTVGFVRFIIITTLIDSFSSSIITGIQATGKIKKYQVTVGFFVFLSLPISYFLYWLGFSVYTAFVPLISLSILNLMLRGYFIARLSFFDLACFYKRVIFPCILSSVLSLGFGYLIKVNIEISSVFGVLFLSSLYSLIAFIFIFLFVVSKNEKVMIIKYLEGVIK